MNPSNNIDFYRIPNLPIEDNAGLFNFNFNSLLACPIVSSAFTIENTTIKLYLYTYNNINSFSAAKQDSRTFSDNEMAVYILNENSGLRIQIKLSKYLQTLSRFQDEEEMIKFSKTIKLADLFAKTYLSIPNIIDLLEYYGIPLFPVPANEKSLGKLLKPISLIAEGNTRDNTKNKVTYVKDKLNVTIGLFFDGTNNSKFSTEILCDKIYTLVNDKNTFSDILEKLNSSNEEIKNNQRKELKDKFSEGDFKIEDFMFEDGCSYLNGYTNVYYLWKLYQTKDFDENNPSDEIIIKQYIQGIGPNAELDPTGERVIEHFEDDDVFGKGMGRNGPVSQSGVSQRFEDGVRFVINKLNELTNKKTKKGEKLELGTITFDLFGFSRGAAVARLFHNDINKIYNSTNPAAIQPISFFSIIASNLNFKLPEKKDIKIRFLGLYDTVYKVFSGNEISISLKNSESIVCHISSKFAGKNLDDEFRKNFPLVVNDAPNKIDICLFGSHSDIGGSYIERTYKTNIAIEQAGQKMFSNDKKRYFKEEFELFSNKYAIKYDKNKAKINKNQITVKSSNDNQFKILVDNRLIKNRIVLPSLFAMIRVANQINLPFPNVVKSFNEITQKISDLTYQPNFKIEDEKDNTLLSYHNSIQELIKEWIEGKNKIEKKIEKKDFFNLFNGYIHISSDFNNFKLIEGLKDFPLNVNYINEPEKERQRKIKIPE